MSLFNKLACLIIIIALGVCYWLTVNLGVGQVLLSSHPLVSFPLASVNSSVQTQPAPQTYRVTGQPSLNAAFINLILTRAHSLAAGTGQALYELSQTYGIDDAYALAFFKEESQYGTTGRATHTLSLGNIKCSDGYSCMSGYRTYTSWRQGYEDWYCLIRHQYVNKWHLVTVWQIIPVYAPITDGNDVPAYIKTVEQAVDAWHQGQLEV